MATELYLKLQKLCNWFAQHDQVTVAYSGGVDSSLLLYIGTQVLGRKRCSGLFADSCLISPSSRVLAMEFADSHALNLHPLSLEPLTYSGFSKNTPERCYICKKQTYETFLRKIPKTCVLVDGTNIDDLLQDRPGLQALQELGIATPFVDCQIPKDSIRSMSYHLGLATWDRLSDSCLATRVSQGSTLTVKELQLVARMEQELCNLGFTGCRVRMHNGALFLTVSTGQIKQLLDNDILKQIQEIGRRSNFTKVFLDLFEREGILPSLLDYIGFVANRAPKKQFLDHFNKLSGLPSAKS